MSENKTDLLGDDNLLDIDEEFTQDSKLDLDVFIKSGLLSAQRALLAGVVKGNVGEAMTAYSILIEQLEVIAIAKKYLGEDYARRIDEYLKSKEYREIERKDVKLAKLANRKLHLILCNIADTAPLNMPIKV